jgi:hypothetical protein
MKFTKYLLAIQGSYTFITAIWPIIHINSFMWISGYKHDVWLVKTVGVCLLAISVCLLTSIFSKGNILPIAALALFISVGLAYVDFYYALNNVIRAIYMADGVIEIVFALCWLITLRKRNVSNESKASLT